MCLKLLTSILLLLILLPVAAFSADCSDVYFYADNAYTQAKRGYNSDNLGEAHYYAKKTMSAAKDAMSAAEIFGCDDAYSATEEAHDYAKKAYRSDNYDDAIDYLRKAKSSADDAMSYADDCE